jgi:hypothetical protein
MPDALKVVAERVSLRPCAHDEHISRAYAILEALVDQESVDHSP